MWSMLLHPSYKVDWWDTRSQTMKEFSIDALNVTTKQPTNVIWCNTRTFFMKMSSITVINVITYIIQNGLMRHIKSVHERVYYWYTQCDYKATQTFYLTQHMNTPYEGAKYNCDQYYYICFTMWADETQEDSPWQKWV